MLKPERKRNTAVSQEEPALQDNQSIFNQVSSEDISPQISNGIPGASLSKGSDRPSNNPLLQEKKKNPKNPPPSKETIIEEKES